MTSGAWSAEVFACETEWKAQGYVSLSSLFAAAAAGDAVDVDQRAVRLCQAFNGAPAARAAIKNASARGRSDAANLAAWMTVQDLVPVQARALSWEQADALEQSLLADPDGVLAKGTQLYPLSCAGRHFGLDPHWIQDRLTQGRARFDRFVAARESDTAILVGNGPSLKQTDLSLLRGQDVYISNYAIRNDALRSCAKGVAVSNYLVAEQEPHVFQIDNLWKFHPAWMSHVLGDSDSTVWLQALGGSLFFGSAPRDRIAWHATVTYFWMQILYGAGYRRVLLIGVDNSYQQAPGLKEGDVVAQHDDDPNHFDPAYFKGKVWQAADTSHMAETYAKARAFYERDGREIVNCTVGGSLEVFRRASLAQMVR